MLREKRLSFYPVFLSTIIALLFSASASAQNWKGILDPSRAANWSNAGAGAIPARTTHCADLGVAGQSSSYAQSITGAQINSAIAACPANQVVYLNPGTYTITSGITFAGHNNVTLRGAGPTQTILNFTGGNSCGGQGGDICASSANPIYPGSSTVAYGTGSKAANWTGTTEGGAGVYPQGATHLTLSSVSGLSVGMYIFLDQLNDNSSDTNGVYVCDTVGACSIDTAGGNQRSGRAQLEIKKITAISGNTVTIASGLYNNNWRSSQSPGAWWVGTMLTGVGIEDLTVNHNGTGSNINSGIYFFNAAESWVKNVKSLYPVRNHIWCYTSTKLTIRDSYFYGTQANAERSYGIENFGCGDELLENNIAQHLPEIVVTDNTSGLVSAYNYTIDHAFMTASWLQGGQRVHASGTSMNLYEGNYDSGYTGDVDHGTHNLDTSFRNWYTGWESGKTQQTVPVLLYTHNRGMNFIGNVLGWPGYHNHYQNAYDGATTPTSVQTTIYSLGYCANVGSISNSACGSLPNDALTPTSLMRWGNYDVATGTVRWDNVESSPDAVAYINAQLTPASHSLPASFYLSSKPGWWGSTIPWPAIGPDVTTGDGPGGHAYLKASNPAQACYNATPKDGSGILLFNANNCYSQGSASLPAPPTGVIAIVQ